VSDDPKAETAIPQALRERDQWVLWRREQRGDGKPTKVPYQANGHKAACDQPDTWTSYENAIAAAGRFDGIGYVFAADDPNTGVDFDDCLDGDGHLHPAVVAAVELLDTYTEWSPSGGIHSIAEATKNGHTRCRTGKTPWGGVFEVYDQGRYFTVTGDRLPIAPAAVQPRQAELERLLDQLLPLPAAGGVKPTSNSACARPLAQAPLAGDDRASALLEEFPKLAQIVAHRGSPPSDKTPSGWDHMLACRAVELGVDRDGVAALVRHHRSTLKDPKEREKGQRDDYVRLTVDKAFGTVGAPITRHQDILPELTRRLRLAGRELALADVRVSGDEGLTKFIASDGRLMVFDRLSDVAKNERLADALAASFGVSTEFSRLQARGVVALVREYIGPATELQAEVMFAGWVVDLLSEAIAQGFRDTDAAGKSALWQTMHDTTPSTSGDAQAFAAGVVVAVEQATGDHYIRSGWLQAYIALCGSKDGPGVVRDRLLAIGLQQRGNDGQVKATDPRTGNSRKLRFYIAPRAWVERWEGEQS
jgi:hypothetical protein